MKTHMHLQLTSLRQAHIFHLRQCKDSSVYLVAFTTLAWSVWSRALGAHKAQSPLYSLRCKAQKRKKAQKLV